MKLIVGLGNPGKKYQETRHNVGFMFVDKIANDLGIKFTLNKQLKSEIAEANVKGEKVILIKPQTFMNLSGEAVRSVQNYYKIELEDILVIYDDLDLPTGKIRIRKSGSSGGHKGMQNIIELIKTQEVKRVRIGIDSEYKKDTIDYVLGKFSIDERIQIDQSISIASSMLNSFIEDSFDDFMNKFNRSNTNE
ncbi:MAG TPA: aminoacyl-tRNA hydrolase [Acholeplasmataceae bacterium]|nr:aminoacyl-tRNA hydrolase [Acholeplasmataceae bacterium]